MSSKQIKNYALIALSSLVILPGCFNKSENKSEDKKATGEVLISANGKPFLTEHELENFLEQAAEADPQTRMMITMMPEGVKEQALEAKKRAAIISEWAKHEGVRDSQDYKTKKALITQSIDESLDNEAFMKKHKVEVSDKEAREFYDENKLKDPRFKISQEGTKAFGVSFDTESSAKEFLDSVKSKVSEIEKLAESKKLKTRDFGIVNQESYAPKAIKEAILKAKIPSVQIVKEDNKFWVVASLTKEAAKYHSFDDLKDGIKRMLEGQKMEEMMTKELPKYEKQFGVKVNEDYLKNLKAKREDREKELREQFESQPAQGSGDQMNMKELAANGPRTSGAA